MNYSDSAKSLVTFLNRLVVPSNDNVPVSNPVWAAYKYYTNKSLTGFEMRSFCLYDSIAETNKHMIAIVSADNIPDDYCTCIALIDDIVCAIIPLDNRKMMSGDINYQYSILTLIANSYTDCIKRDIRFDTLSKLGNGTSFLEAAANVIVYLAMRDVHGTGFFDAISAHFEIEKTPSYKFFTAVHKAIQANVPNISLVPDLFGAISIAVNKAYDILANER